MDPFLIREVVKKDRPVIISIIDRVENLNDREKACAKEVLDVYLKDPLAEEYFFYACVDSAGIPVGYISYGRDAIAQGVYEIYWVLVDPLFRRKKVGNMLFDYAEQRLRDAGARLVAIETSSVDSYESARRFYEKLGFHEESKIKDYYKPGDDKLIYVKIL